MHYNTIWGFSKEIEIGVAILRLVWLSGYVLFEMHELEKNVQFSLRFGELPNFKYEINSSTAPTTFDISDIQLQLSKLLPFESPLNMNTGLSTLCNRRKIK